MGAAELASCLKAELVVNQQVTQKDSFSPMRVINLI